MLRLISDLDHTVTALEEMIPKITSLTADGLSARINKRSALIEIENLANEILNKIKGIKND